MAQYVKMSNGPVKVLVDVKDAATLADKMNDGFFAEIDKDGDVVLIDSSTLVASENDAVNNVLNMIKSKQAKMNASSKGIKSK